ncbi:MAG: helix-hairpin-helix domain-containing protein [Myxococcaceae bacterium]
MKLERTGWLAVVMLAASAAGVAAVVRWPDAEPALACPPAQVRWVDAGTSMIARCAQDGEGGPLPAGALLTLGARLDLNRATAEELALVPGVGPSLARELVRERERLGRFSSWEEVDQVRGVGVARLEALQGAAELTGSSDAGRP